MLAPLIDVTVESAAVATAGVLLGALLGSYFDCLAWRSLRQARARLFNRPADPLLHARRSHCPACRRPLNWLELLPVISWVRQGGRCGCRHRRPLGTRPLLAELTLALLGLAAGLRFGISLAAIEFLLLGGFLLSAALCDLERRFIPDALTLPMIATGTAFAVVGLAVEPPALPFHLPWSRLFLPWIVLVAGHSLDRLLLAKGRRDGLQELFGIGDLHLMAGVAAFQDAQLLLLSLALTGPLALGAALLTRRRRLPAAPIIAVAAIAACLLSCG